MNHLEPYELHGKVIKECYETLNGFVIEFTDGTKIEIVAGMRREGLIIEIHKKII